jgi:hypothetical protein
VEFDDLDELLYDSFYMSHIPTEALVDIIVGHNLWDQAHQITVGYNKEIGVKNIDRSNFSHPDELYPIWFRILKIPYHY